CETTPLALATADRREGDSSNFVVKSGHLPEEFLSRERHMTTPRLAWLCRALSLLVFAATPAFADYVTRCLQDPSRAAIRGASVTLTGSDNAVRIQAQTDEKGCFTIDTEPGRYRIRVLAQGFSPYESDVVPAEKITLQIRPVEAETVVTATRTLS